MPGSRSGKSAASRKRHAPPAKQAPITPKRRAARRRSAGKGTHLNESTIMAFLATADAVRARAFYETVVGLHFVADDPFALVFDANGIMVRIQKVETVKPAAYTTLGWKVTDIAATIRRLNANGVQCDRYGGLEQDTLGVWTSPSGARIAWFKDPEGHVLSLTQF
jgi:predicted enzyme related to lactoylglutathione lyase